MNVTTNSVIQTLGLAAQGVNAGSAGKYQLWIALALAALQGITGVIAHFYNPDATSAKTAYTPKNF